MRHRNAKHGHATRLTSVLAALLGIAIFTLILTYTGSSSGRLAGFSSIGSFLVQLGSDVEIVVKPRRAGQTRVLVA